MESEPRQYHGGAGSARTGPAGIREKRSSSRGGHCHRAPAYEDASNRWQRYREDIRPKSAEVRTTKAYAYQKGGASLLDMLVAERDDNEVRLAAIQAASDTTSVSGGVKSCDHLHSTFGSQEMKPRIIHSSIFGTGILGIVLAIMTGCSCGVKPLKPPSPGFLRTP